MPDVPYNLGPFATRAEAQTICDEINQWNGIAAVVEEPDAFYVRVTREPDGGSSG